MSHEMAFADVPTREDCASCTEAGGCCALHQTMFERQQELDAMAQPQQAHNHGPAEHVVPQAKEESQMSRIAAKEMNRLRTQEGQMISVSFRPSHSVLVEYPLESLLTVRRL